MRLSKRLDVVGLDTISFDIFEDISFLWVSPPLIDECEPGSDLDFDDVLALDVLVTVALDVAFNVNCEVEEAVVGTILQHGTKSLKYFL